MDREEFSALARQWISLWCVPVDWKLFDRLHADDFEDCASAGRGTRKADFGRGLQALVTAFPDIKTQVDDVLVDEASQKVAIRWTAIGTHKGRFQGREPSGQRTPMSGIEIIEIQDGRIIRRWGEWDAAIHLARA